MTNEKIDFTYIGDDDSGYVIFDTLKESDWTCYMWGNTEQGNGWQWTPTINSVPNAWVRFWMRVFLGCTWVKK